MTEVQNAASGADPGNAAVAAAVATQGDQQNQNSGQSAQNGAANGSAQNSAANGAQIAAGGESQPQPEPKPYWPEDWRQKLAEHVSAGDKKAYDKELKRLESMADPTNVYSSYRSIENTWASRNFIKLPGKDSKPEDIAEFNKALGVPEKPEDYFKDIKLESGAVIGDADKPLVDGFAQAVHKVGAPPQVVNAALNWYFKQQEDQAAALDEADEKFRLESERSLKEELGPAFKRKTNAISSLFDIAPGGPDIKNDKSLYARLMGGRTADGKMIGNDPDMVRFLVALAMDRNPAATVVEDGDQSGKSIDAEIREIEQVMRTDRPRYNKEFAGRYSELLSAREKIRARVR
jgi:hypothetical protein